MIPRRKNKRSGFMMVEVIIVTSILVVSVLAAMSITQKSIYISHQSLHVSEASFLLEEGAELMRTQRDNAWSNISNLQTGVEYYPLFSSGSWSLSNSPSQIGIFTRTVSVSNVNRDEATGDIGDVGVNDPGTKLVTVNVAWNEGGKAMNKTLSFYLMNIFSS